MNLNSKEIDIVINALKNPDDSLCQQKLSEWIDDDTSKKKLYRQLNSSWMVAAQLPDYQQLDERAATENFKKKLSALINEKERKTRASPFFNSKKLGYWSSGIAATLVLLAVCWLLWPRTTYLTVATSDKQDTVQLVDGSIVYLNKNTVFKYPTKFDAKLRLVQLEKGEIFLEVHHDENIPFEVETGKVRVKVLGTTFNVKNADSLIRVQVNSGRVSFKHQESDPVLLTKGMAAELDIAGNSIKKIIRANPNDLSWKTHTLVFERAPLDKVVRELENYYQVDILLQNNTEKRLTSTFKEKSLEEVLSIMRVTLNLKIHRKNNRIIIK